MLAHPLPASEDDEESLVRNVYDLKNEVDEYFELVAKIFEEHDKDLKPRAIALHASLKSKFEQLSAIPVSTFRVKATGEVDDEIMSVIKRLHVMFARDVDQLTYGALSWRRTALKLIEELITGMSHARIHFPFHRRFTRQVLTAGSVEYVILMSLNAVTVLGCCITLIALPIVQPSSGLGAAIGVAAALLLLAVFLLNMYLLDTAMKSVQLCWKYFTEDGPLLHHGNHVENSATSLLPAPVPLTSPRLRRESFSQGFSQGSGGTLSTFGVAGPHVFTLKYINQQAYIDAKHIESQVLMIGVDTSFKVTYWNNAAEAATGFLKGECIGQFLWDLADAPGAELRTVMELAVAAQDRSKQIVKIRLRSFATAPISLLTIIAPVSSIEATPTIIGNLLICANAQDNLREARAYLNDYQALQVQLATNDLIAEGALSPEGREIATAISKFLPAMFSVKLDAIARSMVQEWEWTNATQLLSQAVAKFLGKCRTSIDTSFPNTICVNTFVPGIIEQIIQAAPKRCEVHLSVKSHPACQSSYLVIDICVPPSSRPFNGPKLLAAIQAGVHALSGVAKMVNGDTGVLLHFPCQITSLQDASVPAEGMSLGEGISTSVNVLTVVTNMVEEHNISMTLLRARHVSVTNARDQQDVSNRLSNTPCDVDVIIADKQMLPMVKQMLEDLGLVQTVTLVPLLQGSPAAAPNPSPKVNYPDNTRQSSSSSEDYLPGASSGSLVSTSDASAVSSVHASSAVSNPGAAAVVCTAAATEDTAICNLADFVLYTPIEYFALERLIKAVAASVTERKRLKLEAAERERILASRQDSPWTRGKALGRGSFGEVYEAISDLTGGKMAVKMFFMRSSNETETRALLNEVRIMCSLNHPNIVHYFHCEEKDRSINLFMELCDCSLGDIMYGLKKSHTNTKVKINTMLKQVIAAVAYLHGMGIAHRDIKPQNILMKDDFVKLTDFGTAKQNTPNEVMSDTQGTFRYMAPEVFKGEPHKLSCDVWSIGCIACDLCGVTPGFMGAGNLNALGELTHVTLPMMPRLAADFVAQCLLVQQELRPAASMLLLHPFLANSAENDALTEKFYQGKMVPGNGRNVFSLSSATSSSRRESL